MTTDQANFRQMGPRALDAALHGARQRTLDLFAAHVAAGHDQAARVPCLAIVNPPLWELGHIAWFAEWFILREAASSQPGDAVGHSLLGPGDDWFDSNTVAHGARWSLGLPVPDLVKTYCRDVLEQVSQRLAHTPDDDAALYPYRLALAHEDMHGEALLYTLQTLGVAPPTSDTADAEPVRKTVASGEIDFAGGSLLLGGDQARGFVFDNERQAAMCQLAPFTIDAGLVSNAAFLAFVRDGGYRCPAHWSEDGRAWLARQQRQAPRYWQREGGMDDWHTVRFGRPNALDLAAPVRHVSLYEAQAYCSWAKRRLPLEQEWEYAASAGHPGFGWGGLWEWTASPFLPYAGFSADRYREYSLPSFGHCQSLRGASFATPPRMHSPRFRNFFVPERDDIFVGFRTCAP